MQKATLCSPNPRLLIDPFTAGYAHEKAKRPLNLLLQRVVVAFKKASSSKLNTRRGADDASMALSVIRKGYKCKYVPTAKFYEYVPDKFYEQRRQKIRRATRLLEATFFNRDVLFS